MAERKTAKVKKDPPIFELDVGTLNVAGWVSEGKFGPMYRATLSRDFKKKSGEWESAGLVSLREEDLLPSALRLCQAWAKIQGLKREETKTSKAA